jgi:hypothetical protein
MILPSSAQPSCVKTSPRRSYGGGMPHSADFSLGRPGRCPIERPTHLALVFDDSGSVGSPGGNDPVGARFEEARLAIKAVAKRCRCKRELVSVTHFDYPASRDLPPTSLSRTGGIESALSVPIDGAGCSLLGPSLDRAYDLVKQLPDHDHLVLVLSDFLLFDSDLDGVLEKFASFPGDPHAVVLRAEPPPRLRDDPRVQVTRVSYTDPPGAVARTVFNALTSHRRGASVSAS